MKKPDAKYLARAGIIAALYIVLTLIISSFGLASGQIQVRISEALCVLPVLMPAAIPGLFVGCMFANIITGGTLLDVIFGSLATLIGALGTFALKKKPFLATLPPVIANTLVIPFVILEASGIDVKAAGLSSSGYFVMAGSIAIGELVSCTGLGYLLYLAIKKRPGMLE